MSDGRRRFAVAVTLVLVAGACSSGGHGSAIQASTTTAPTTPAAVTTTTVDPTKAAILAAYRAGWADYIAIAESYPVKPLDPRLALHDTGNELSGARKALTGLSALGHYNQGTTDLSPTVTSVTGDKAVVTDCVFDHSFEVDARTKQPVEQPDIGHTLYQFEMKLIGAIWYASDSMLLKSGKAQDACSPVGS